MDYQYIFKVVIVGDSSVGKSSLVTRFSDGTFTDSYLCTIGLDFKIRTLYLNGQTIKLQIWDTAGNERYRSMAPIHYRGAHGVVVVYDVTSLESFTSVNKWLEEVDVHIQGPVSRLLVGNKADLIEKIAVESAIGKKLASSLGIPFIETSAKEATNVVEAFHIMAREIMTQRSQYSRSYLVETAEKEEEVEERNVIIGRTNSISNRNKRCCSL